MGIRLDWELESEAGWSDIGEDPAEVLARRRRNRHLRNLLVTLLMVAAVIGGVVGWRLRAASRQLRKNLETTIAAETTALRIGDEDGFLSAQSEIGQWRRLQQETFEEYRSYGTRLVVTGEIIELDISANRARVVLTETLDEQPYHVIWFYEHQEGDWRHIASSPDFWGDEQVVKVRRFEIAYREADRALAEALAANANHWWDDACRLTGCTAYPPDVTVRIEPDPLVSLGWSSYNRWTLLVPSPQLERLAEDGAFDPALLDQVAAAFAERWASHVISARTRDVAQAPSPEIAWLEQELSSWLTYSLTGNGSPGFLRELEAAYGTQTVTDLLHTLPAIATENSIIAPLEAVTGHPVTDLPVSWDSYFTYRLQAEASMIADGFETEAMLIYRDPERQPTPGFMDYAGADSIKVIGTQRVGELLWAEVQITHGEAGVSNVVNYREPFRLLDGRWVHTWPYQQDWGALHEERGTYLDLAYYDLDQAAAEGLLSSLDQVYAQAMQDYGLSPTSATPMRVVVTSYGSTVSGSNVIVVTSPYIAPLRPDVTPQQYLYESAAYEIISRLLMPPLGTFPPNHPLVVAFLTREAEIAGLDPAQAQARYIEEIGSNISMWPSNGEEGPLTFYPPYQEEDYTASRILLSVLEQRYGAEAIPVLLHNLRISTDLDDWLTRTLGITLQEIEDEWNQAAGAQGLIGAPTP